MDMGNGSCPGNLPRLVLVGQHGLHLRGLVMLPVIIIGVVLEFRMQRIGVEHMNNIAHREHQANVLRVKFAIMICEHLLFFFFQWTFGTLSNLILSREHYKEISISTFIFLFWIGRYECDARNLSPPTAQPITDQPTKAPAEAGPTDIPTDMPIPPPDPLPYPSDDPSDHWFCGIGIDDASTNCEVHCPSASECPAGQSEYDFQILYMIFHSCSYLMINFSSFPFTSAVCYFGTKCDARTHSPTPPPTRRPTPLPWAPLSFMCIHINLIYIKCA